MNKVILVTGSSSGFGAMSARALAEAGHVVYASMRDPDAGGGASAKAMLDFAKEAGLDIRVVALDVTSDASAERAVAQILAEAGRLDVIVHNAGHMGFGPAEAFTPGQLAQFYEVNAIGPHRLNRAALPHMRSLGRALLVWVGSSSTRGGHPPFLAPYFAAKAAMDSLAESYASELSRFGVETTIVVPGAFTQGTNHFAHAAQPGDAGRAEAYWSGPYAGTGEQILKGLAALEPADADPAAVAEAIVKVVDMPHGRRPFRVHIDPSDDGAEIVNGVADRVRGQLFERIGMADLLRPASWPTSPL